MSKRYSCLVLTVLILALCIPAANGENYDAWNFSAPVEFQGQEKYKAVFLTKEVYQDTANDLADLRLVDNTGNQVPYYIVSSSQVLQRTESTISTRLIDSFEAGDDKYFDYAVNTPPNTDPIANTLKFSLPVGNFLKHLEIYGSYDNVNFQKVANGYLYQVESKQKSQVALEKNSNYRYYRIRVINHAEELALSTLELVNVQVSSEWQKYQQKTDLHYDVKSQNHETVITLDNPQRLRVKQLMLDVDGNFQRTYRVYSDNNHNMLQTGELFNLSYAGIEISGQTISFSSPLTAPRLIIKIADRDDRPLTIKNIEAEYHVDKLVFPIMSDATSYHLYWGNPKTENPRYEIALQQKYIEEEQQEICVLGPVISHSQPPTVPCSDGSYLFNGAIAVTSLILIFIVLRRMNAAN